MVKIGKISLDKGIILAPMAGFSDSAMRTVSHKFGAEYSVTEMVSAKAVVYGDKKTFSLAKIRESEGNVGIQIFGSDPCIMAKAAQTLSKPKEGCLPCAIDINMGCPVPKVYTNGDGSALMKDPALIYKIVKEVSGAVDIPVTVKIRAGITDDTKNAVECALAAEAGGASLVAVHGRTRVQMYSGKVDTEIIKKVKENLNIPVIANGDITSGAGAVEMLSLTGADAVMIGRGAIGDPFVFSEISAAFSGEEYINPSLSARVETALTQLSLAIEDKGEEIAVREARKQIALYIRSFRGAAAIRKEINLAKTFSDVERAMSTVFSYEN